METLKIVMSIVGTVSLPSFLVVVVMYNNGIKRIEKKVERIQREVINHMEWHMTNCKGNEKG